MTGYGTLYYPEGVVAYQGNWLKDEFHGTGTLFNDNPQIIRGNFDYTDFSVMEDDQWQSYEGEFRESNRDGKGKLTLSNGESYEGELEDNLPHGSGMFSKLKGSPVKGVWSRGKLKTIFD